MSITGYVIVATTILFASALQGSIGFGIGMLSAPIIALVDPSLIPGTLIMIATLVTLMVVVRERESIDLHGTGWALLGRVPGTVAGALLLMLLPARGLAIMLAAVVLAGVAVTSFGWIPAARRRNVVLAGAASGVFGTATAIGGPPMALVWQRSEGAQLRGTMSGFFLVGSLMSIAALAATGAVTGHTLIMFAALVPAALAGYVVSRGLNRVLDPTRLRWLAITASALGAVLLIGRELLQMGG
ncbi:sulfite exporter TauE/SafE family protein [Mycolicibacterium flavescens]|uniref:Probable membrane transporter protein n=1 Tax=Mycolicibacterium flavescens TaxID=1776 RepID=A0A1E3RCL1_MYCFV|nr:sulfite exporter TauE/SafE family protein [Mycolicibacterium flavescens]MCV7278322.1 sulfite exporter TauE/SafE family protein [Mycolicibacterium flavescens]ODQ87162.1 permease [Mycolicibacterium flavescens]